MLVLNADTGVSMVQDDVVDPKTDIVKNVPCFSAYQSVAQSIGAAWTKINFNVEEFDTTNHFDLASSRFQPNIAGYYQVSVALTLGSDTAGYVAVAIYKNGATYKNGGTDTSSTGKFPVVNGSAIVFLNGSTDYVEEFGAFGSTANSIANAYSTYFQAHLIVGA